LQQHFGAPHVNDFTYLVLQELKAQGYLEESNRFASSVMLTR
jgi:hypothetical protein